MNITEEAQRGHEKITCQKDLKVSDMEQLHDLYKAKGSGAEALYNVITTAFYMGFERGKRGTK